VEGVRTDLSTGEASDSGVAVVVVVVIAVVDVVDVVNAVASVTGVEVSKGTSAALVGRATARLPATASKETVRIRCAVHRHSPPFRPLCFFGCLSRW
jgi:hypothetical protein